MDQEFDADYIDESRENMESLPSNNVQTHSAEAEGVIEDETQLERLQVPPKQTRDIGWKWKLTASAKGFRGEIREMGDGNIEWKDGNTWVPAVYHDTIRAKLIEQAGQPGSYDHRRKHGLDPLDVTSFHPDQKTWGPDRNEHWPFMPDQLLFRLERRGYPVPDYEVTRWIDEGRVVLDIDNRPVKNFPNIPSTLSSEAEAYLMEMISRMDTRICHRDFRARMPHSIQTGTDTKRIVSLGGIDMRVRRFRYQEACPSWDERRNSGGLKAFVMDLLSEEGLQRNSTQELSGLTKIQQEIVKKGKRESPSSPSSKTFNPKTSALREQADVRRWARLLDAERDKVEDSIRGQKRKREDESLLGTNIETPSSSSRNILFAITSNGTRCGWLNEPPSSSYFQSRKKLMATTATQTNSSQIDYSPYTSSQIEEIRKKFSNNELDVTAADFKRWLGYWPLLSNPEDSFEVQYNNVQMNFNARWRREGPPPQLMSSRTWDPTLDYGSIELRLLGDLYTRHNLMEE